MGVMPCSRKGCERILCTRLIFRGSRYICDTCWEELLRLKDTWTEAEEVEPGIKAFLETTPGTSSACSVDEAFDSLIR